jgi:hypothetical protein
VIDHLLDGVDTILQRSDDESRRQYSQLCICSQFSPVYLW